MCHRVTVDHLQLAGIRFSLSVPGDSPRGSRCIGPDFIEPFVARSGHDFVQAPVRANRPIGRVWMFLAFKASRLTATAILLRRRLCASEISSCPQLNIPSQAPITNRAFVII